MATKFNPSVNIIRDSDKELSYIPTPNAVRILSHLEKDFQIGIHSFTLIGSYGTGKSSFLVALEQTLRGIKDHFSLNAFKGRKVEFINLVGEYNSLQSSFAKYLGVSEGKDQPQRIFLEIFNIYSDLGKNHPILFITIDEFGKFLEFAAQNNPEKELYFIQELSEFVNSVDFNIIFLTSVHQNFDAYSISLNPKQKQEWSKVKGRFKEILFNEPIEQLLYLAAEHLKVQNFLPLKNEIAQDIVMLFTRAKAFSISSDYIEQIVKKLYPLEPFSASVLTIALQRYGQNERSLFSFLKSTDETGIAYHQDTNGTFFDLSHIYDYLNFNFYSFLNSKYNPDFSNWKAIQIALERLESAYDANIFKEIKIVKTIGLLNIYSAAGSVFDNDFLIRYGSLCLGIDNSLDVIKSLEDKKIILYRNYSSRYVLLEGTDLDIQSALIEAANKVSEITDMVTRLKKYYQLPPIIAKEISYRTGTPRLFEYVISDQPIEKVPKGEIDGFINLIFNDNLNLIDIISVSAKQEEAILYCYYKKSARIKELLLEIEKTNRVIEENLDDKIAVRELTNSIIHQKNYLTHKILNNFSSTKSEVVWFYQGKPLDIPNRGSFNKKLSEICNEIYFKAPIFNNELVNKHKISSSIHTAKRNYYRALVQNWEKPQLGFPENRFPPEKTIYLSLLETNGISVSAEEIDLEISTKNRFDVLWSFSRDFLESSKGNRRKISDFVEFLTSKPFKLKQGLIDFWVPTFLFLKRNEFAIFSKDGFLPVLNEEVLELVVKNPQEFEIKAFDIKGIKLDLFNRYRVLLEKSQESQITSAKFLDTIKPFLLFYRDLPEYTKRTTRLSKNALQLREAIAKSIDPEKTFFEDFPLALGYTLQQIQNSSDQLQHFVENLQLAIKEIRTCYSDLNLRLEAFIREEFVGKEIPFEKIKDVLLDRFKGLRKHLLMQNQKVFIQRIGSIIEDKDAWMNSLVQSLLGKSLNKIKDEEEVIIFDLFKEMMASLDTLTGMSNSNFIEENEDVMDLQISSFADGVSNKLIRLPKNKQQQVQKIESSLEEKLSEDLFLNIAALTNLLKKLIK